MDFADLSQVEFTRQRPLSASFSLSTEQRYAENPIDRLREVVDWEDLIHDEMEIPSMTAPQIASSVPYQSTPMMAPRPVASSYRATPSMYGGTPSMAPTPALKPYYDPSIAPETESISHQNRIIERQHTSQIQIMEEEKKSLEDAVRMIGRVTTDLDS